MADTTKDGKGERGDWLRRSVILSALLAVAGLTAGTVFWFHGAPEEALARAEAPDTGQTPTAPRATAPAPSGPEPVHVDVYFDFKSTRLRADAARLLEEKAALVTSGEPWTVLVQGHTDGRGDATYNRTLAQRRADVVKQFLVELGVPETSIRAAALGQESALCDDPSDACQQLNRRVHLEFRRLPRTSAVEIAEPVHVLLAQADGLQTGDESDEDDHDCPGDAEDEADWSAISSPSK